MVAHTVTPSAFYSGAWNDFPAEVMQEQGITITRGLTEQGELRPSTIAWRWNDETGKWRPTNPASPIYGEIGRNMPIRITVDGSVRAYCEASSFAPDQDPEFQQGVRGRRWVDLTAEGTLRRIGMWSEPIRSPMYRQITGYSTRRGHWPLEDTSQATQLTNTTSGRPGTFSAVDLADTDPPPGAERAVKTPAGSSMGGRFLGASAAAGWQFAWSCKLNALPASHTEMISWTTSNGYTWSWQTSATAFKIYVVDASGAVVIDAGVGHGSTIDPDQWTSYRVKVYDGGSGFLTIEAAWFGVGPNNTVGFSWFPAGTPGALTSWSVTANTATTDARWSHVFGLTTVGDDLNGANAQRTFDGYLGEKAGNRFARLLTEAGLPYGITGNTADTQPMGPQKSDTLIELLKEVARTEDGLIYDSKLALRPVLRTRRSLLNQTPLALTYPGDIAPALREVIDDDAISNRVTVSQRDGGEATAVLDQGPLSVQPPPAGVGEYKKSIDVNVADETTLDLLAGWWLNRGTAQGRGGRYPQVTVDLDAHPELITAVNDVEIGGRITITGREPEPIGLLVLGISETVHGYRRTVTFTCVPDTVWNPGVYDGPGTRYDSASSTLAVARTTTQTSWAVNTTMTGHTWSTTATPYDWLVAGERVRVTAITAPGGGPGLYGQTATVTRSINGVVKAQAADVQISLATPARYAL